MVNKDMDHDVLFFSFFFFCSNITKSNIPSISQLGRILIIRRAFSSLFLSCFLPVFLFFFFLPLFFWISQRRYIRALFSSSFSSSVYLVLVCSIDICTKLV